MKRTLILIALTKLVLVGCSPAATQEEARDAYLAAQTKCVTDAKNGPREQMRAEIDSCRARVKSEWGRDTSAKDAGVEGGAR